MPDAPLTPGGGYPLQVGTPGLVGYGEALEMQAELVRRRREGVVPDQFVLLEHPHVITLGRGSGEGHVLVSEEERGRRGVELFEAGRGGDVTYHGPGQVVGYPILLLEEERRDLHRYLRELEEVLIMALAALGIQGGREPGLTGVWVNGGKIAAVGVRVSSGWITSHGFALNVRTDLSFFETIIPCGINDRQVTSVERILGPGAPIPDPVSLLVPAFCQVFGRQVVPGSPLPLERLPSLRP